MAALKAVVPSGAGGAGQGAPPSPGARPSPGTEPPDRGAMFSTVLAPLVEDGTITAAQQEAIGEVLTAGHAGGSRRSDGPARHEHLST